MVIIQKACIVATSNGLQFTDAISYFAHYPIFDPLDLLPRLLHPSQSILCREKWLFWLWMDLFNILSSEW